MPCTQQVLFPLWPLPFWLKRGRNSHVLSYWNSGGLCAPDHLCCFLSFLLFLTFSEQTSQKTLKSFFLVFFTSAKAENSRICICILLLSFVVGFCWGSVGLFLFWHFCGSQIYVIPDMTDVAIFRDHLLHKHRLEEVTDSTEVLQK